MYFDGLMIEEKGEKRGEPERNFFLSKIVGIRRGFFLGAPRPFCCEGMNLFKGNVVVSELGSMCLL